MRTKRSHGAVSQAGKKARKAQKKRKSHRDRLNWQTLNTLKQYPPHSGWTTSEHEKSARTFDP